MKLTQRIHLMMAALICAASMAMFALIFKFPSFKLYRHKDRQEDSSKKPKSSPKYVSYTDSKPIEMYCGTCAYVSSSGHMIGSNLKEEIDSHDCVIRSNGSPVVGYERDVGTRTTFRMVEKMSLDFLDKQMRSPKPLIDITLTNGTYIVMCTYISMINETRKVIEIFKHRWPDAKIFMITKQQILNIFKIFTSRIDEVIKDVLISNGFYTLLFMHELCNDIDVYGITDPDYCDRLQNKPEGMINARYHYHDNDGADPNKIALECDYMKEHKTRDRDAHRFFHEKHIFAKWIVEWGNLHFLNPPWPKQQ